MDEHLLEALTKAYTARAKLFHNGVKASRIDLLITEIDNIDESQLDWVRDDLGISNDAFQRVEEADGLRHQVFAHPDILMTRPHLIAYYRNLVTISKKGIGQLLFSTEAYETGRKEAMEPEDAIRVCNTLNRIINGVILGLPDYNVALSRQAIWAEIGTELQGSWANIIGQQAANEVQKIFHTYLEEKGIGQQIDTGRFELENGWVIQFGNEPDISFIDDNQVKQIAVEIKGSLDKAGAQTRYGEAKKSFGKQLEENPRCHTVYLASCFTDAVIEQIRRDNQVREWFNLTSILFDERERERFLNRIFHIVNTPV
jgi:hypothetical protein